MSVVFGTWIQPLTNYLTIYARPFIFFSANEYSFKFCLPGPDGTWINIFSVSPRKACQIHKISIVNFNPPPNSMFLTIDQNLCIINYSICYIFFVSAKICFILVYFHIFFWQNVVRRYRRSRINLLWHTIRYGAYTHCTLRPAHCKRSTIHYTPYTTHCTLHTSNYKLHTVLIHYTL